MSFFDAVIKRKQPVVEAVIASVNIRVLFFIFWA